MADKKESKRRPDWQARRTCRWRQTPSLPNDPVEPEPSRVVYRRTEPAAVNIPVSESVARARSIWTRELSPAIIPLIIGFLSLLILIAVIGYLSVTRMDDVGRAVLDLETAACGQI